MAGADGNRAIDTLADAYRAHAIRLVRIEAGLQKPVLEILERLERELIAKLQASEVGDLTDTQRTRLETLLAQARGATESFYRGVGVQALRDLGELSAIEAAWLSGAFTTAVATELLTNTLTGEQLASIAGETLIQGAPTADWWKRAGVGLSDRFADEMRLGLSLGETNAELVRRVRGTKANGYQDGVMQASRRGAEALVRSSVQAVANETRTRFYEANTSLVKGTIYLATLDSRTTQQCAALDGYRWDMEGNPASGQGRQISQQRPPLHWGCRSTLLPWLRSFEELGFGKVDLPPAARASLDGPQVLGSEGFEGWLKKKPAAFQDELIGTGKAKLFRAGKIGLRDLVDQRGRPLSLAELQATL